MNQSTKQRVVGTVVLLAIAMIFLPIIFDGEGSYQRPLSSRIPQPPSLQVMPDPIPQRPVILADSVATVTANEKVVVETGPGSTVVEEVTVIEADSPAIATAPVLDEAGLPTGWSVRLGSFSNSNNARNLTRRLLTAGYRAYTREFSVNQNVLTAVFVGPQVEREKTEQLKQQLQDEFQLSGIVVRFEVDTL
ncbi:MAG: SPOR domain-containing protein [Gammaproteobacteria bacterium]|nr:SPOR domain-containing protein [Gammaproteobacteria bacterium]